MPSRITLSRAKGWRKPAGAVIVARPSIWGNPWGIGSPGTIDLTLVGVKTRYFMREIITPDRAVHLYSNWLETGGFALPPANCLTTEGHRLAQDHLHGRRMQILANLHELRGRDLCCWCKPGQPCHADVLLRVANAGDAAWS